MGIGEGGEGEEWGEGVEGGEYISITIHHSPTTNYQLPITHAPCPIPNF
ncbi:MAG: hypothetical protein AAF630_05785 [Cyanobacteria bacterium P01_C01_bin.38]